MRIVKTSKDYIARQLEQFEQQKATHSLQYHLDLVLESMEARDYEKGIFHLDRAWDLDPDDIRAIVQRARVYNNTILYANYLFTATNAISTNY